MKLVKLVKFALTPPIVAFIVALAATLGARAELLVYDGFSTDDYPVDTADGKIYIYKGPTNFNHSVGTGECKWFYSQSVWNTGHIFVFGSYYGLSYPEGSSLTAIGGSVGPNPDQNNSGVRAMFHSLQTDVLKRTSGKIYMSMLLNAGRSALDVLPSAADPSSYHYGFGVCRPTETTATWTMLTSRAYSLSFLIWNKNGTKTLSLVAVDSSSVRKVADICTVTAGTTYLCYAEIDVGAGTNGKEVVKAGAVAVDGSFDFTYDWPVSVESEFINSYCPTAMAVAGSFGTNGDRFLADELRIGTTQADVLPFADGIAVKGSPLRYGEPSPGYGMKRDVVAGQSYTFTMPQGVYTNAAQKVYTCTGWTLTAPDGTVTSGPGLTKTVEYAGGVYKLTWNWIRSGYAPLDYIESTGTQWIDTKVVPTANTSLILDYRLTTWKVETNSRIYLFGAYKSASAGRFQFAHATDTDKLVFGYGASTDSSTVCAPDTDRHVLEVRGGAFTLDGEGPYPSSPIAWSDTSKNLCLFALNQNGTKAYLSPYRLYGCKIYESEALVRNLVPVIRNSDGKAGLLDIAAEDDTFYSNTTGDDFAMGSSLPICMVAGSPSKCGAPEPGYGVKTDIVAGQPYTFTVPHRVVTNDVRTEVYTCTGWTLTTPDGTVTSGPELEKTVTFTDGFHKLTWNWTVTGIFDGYTPLEYIESTGTQYIDTKLQPTSSTTFEMRYKLTEKPTGSTVFGVLGSSAGARLCFGLYSSGVNAAYASASLANYAVTGQPDTNIHTATLKGKTYYIDGRSARSFTQTWSGTAYALYLFAYNNAGSVLNPGELRIYSCSFKNVIDANGNTVNAEFVPCRGPSGEIGLYETVSGKFFGNAATGDAFTAGPVEDILVTGSPAECGTPNPGYGWVTEELVSGKEYTFNPPAPGEADGVRWQCTGWEFVTKSGVKTQGTGTAKITYEEPGTLTWLFSRQFKVEFACSGGDVNTNKLWYAEGDTATVTFTPDEGRAFQMWQGDVAAASKRENPLVFTVDGPKAITGLAGAILEVGEGKTYTDIATAVAAANDYDTVLVYDGTYGVTAAIVIEKPITVRSVNGAAVTTVKNTLGSSNDAVHRVFFINNAEALVEGFTISGGNAKAADSTTSLPSDTYGTGVRIDENGGTVRNCVISGNTVYKMGYGAGFAIFSDKGVISDCVIRSNGSTGYKSCGSIGYMSAGLLTHCTITNNTASNTKTGTDYPYGGLYMAGGRVSHCVFANNKATRSDFLGTAIYQASGKIYVDNTLIKDNSSQLNGGAVYIAGGTGFFTNCTVVGNSAVSGAGGVTVAANQTPKFYGCVFANNTTADSGVNPDIVPQSATFAHCYSTTVTGKSGCTSLDSANFADDGFTPTVSSAFVDQCPPTDYADAATGLDVVGNPRLSGEMVDAGCAEYQRSDVAIGISAPARRSVVGTAEPFVANAHVQGATVLRYKWTADDGTDSDWVTNPNFGLVFAEAGHRTVTLTVEADGVEKGSVTIDHDVAAKDVYVVTNAVGHVPAYPYADKTTAATNIAEALLAAADGSTVHVARGIYSSPVETVVDYGVNLVSEEGAAVTTLRIAGWVRSDVGDTPRPLLIDHKDAFVSGFTFSGGVNGSNFGGVGGPRTDDAHVIEADYGAGVRIGGAGGTLVNCVITGNTANRVGYGGGFAIVSDDGMISNCVIRSNKSANHEAKGSIGYMTAGLLTHCMITNNTADGTTSGCGGLYMKGGRVSHCVFANNKSTKAGARGTAIYQYSTSKAIAIDNTLIKDNSSQQGDGAVCLDASAATFTNCTVVGNSAATGSGGVMVAAKQTPKFYGCVFANNTTAATDINPDIVPASATFKNCYSTTDPGKDGCASGPAAFADDGFTPTIASGFLNLCPPTDYADAATGLDVTGNPRLSGDGVDAGCAEYQYPAVAIDFVVPERRQLAGEAVQVEARAVIAGASLLEYKWDVDGGVAADWTASATAEIRFAEAGLHTLTLTVRADGTPYDPVSKTVVAAAKDIYVVTNAVGHVPAFPYADKTTAATNIAEALLAAADGSTVHVARGTYSSPVETVVDYGVNLVSEEGAAVTTICIANWVRSDVGDIPRPLLIDHKDAFVSGFTLSGGVTGDNVGNAGGPRSDNLHLTSADYGAGVRIGGNGGTLANCVISGNTVYRDGYGGGFAIVSDDGMISNCVIRSNRGSGYKSCGSIGYMAKGLLTHCTITNNTAGGASSNGGLYMAGGRVSHCVFANNKSTQTDALGAAIYQDLNSTSIAVDHTVIRDNSSTAGGTVYFGGSGAFLDNCLIAGNSSVAEGAGVNINAGKLLNCTIVDNVSESSDAGVHCRSTSPIFRNCLIQGNRLTGTATAATTNVNAATKANYTYCLCPEALPTGAGNVQATVTLNSRSVPRAGSAAVDKGSVTGYEDYLVGGTDLLGRPRVFRKVVDIGCCENQSGGLILMVR